MASVFGLRNWKNLLTDIGKTRKKTRSLCPSSQWRKYIKLSNNCIKCIDGSVRFKTEKRPWYLATWKPLLALKRVVSLLWWGQMSDLCV